jgi:phosphoglycerate dehydrogenase-like enzyme
MDRQKRGRWDQDLPILPLPRKALVLGLGKVGGAIAERVGRQGIRVIGARRTKGASAQNLCEEIHGAGSWRSALPDTDWCFLALPRTRETEGLFDEEAMRALPSHAILVNVGRGETLDTAALLRVLSDGHLGGAALDVIDPSPADEKDPIWHAPRLLMTPHVAAHFPGRLEMVEHFFEEQVARYLDGLSLEAVVDLESLLG